VRTFTLVAFHAHPDDEALLSGLTLARTAAAGHRVVLVTATAGERGLAGVEDGRGEELARLRLAELDRSAAALGVARVVCLGYGDSGLHPDADDASAFAHADVGSAAARLAELLREEQADALTVYDANGGYGHPDHVQVHRVGVRAAELAGTPLVLEVTVPARLFRAALALGRLLRHPLGRSAPLGTGAVFEQVRPTHVVDAGPFLAAKHAAMAAHDSQRRGGEGRRSLDYFLRFPTPLFRLVFGREWLVERGRRTPVPDGDLFATLRAREPVRP